MKIYSSMMYFALTIILPLVSHAAQVKVSWDAVKGEFSGYRLYWGNQKGTYTNTMDVDKQHTSVLISSLKAGKTYYFASTTFDPLGNESDYSKSAQVTLIADTDGDGITDEDEINIYGTDPTLADTDGDGTDDSAEIEATSDPTDPSSTPNNNGSSQPGDQSDLILLVVQSVRASGDDGHVAQNTVDSDLTTRWSAEGDGQWIEYDLGQAGAMVNEVAIAWHQGDRRSASFSIEVSMDAQQWSEVFSGDSSGKTADVETYAFAPVMARYVRIVGYGNSNNLWNSIRETEIYGAVN